MLCIALTVGHLTVRFCGYWLLCPIEREEACVSVYVAIYKRDWHPTIDNGSVGDLHKIQSEKVSIFS